MSRVLKNKECALICRTSTTDSSRMLRRYSSPTGPSGLASRKAFNACDLPPKILVHFLCEYSRRNGYIWKTGISIIYSTISCNLPQPGQQTGQSGSTPNPQFSVPIKKRPWHQAKGVFWKWRRRESNSRPLACHATHLPRNQSLKAVIDDSEGLRWTRWDSKRVRERVKFFHGHPALNAVRKAETSKKS